MAAIAAHTLCTVDHTGHKNSLRKCPGLESLQRDKIMLPAAPRVAQVLTFPPFSKGSQAQLRFPWFSLFTPQKLRGRDLYPGCFTPTSPQGRKCKFFWGP